ncbi:NAD(P)/FAD-dependent oxidoreductase [Candidatus Bathyarchaeota archaeon]|nr:NAD(P)/FAD-dependent oxidoreductase [Candidatus Bathyarchaeota archaeon]
MEKHDLVVVGGGTSGCIAGKTAAELGLKVCILEQKIKKEIGIKACGEAVGIHHFYNIGISPPKGDELYSKVAGIDVLSPDLKTVHRIKVKNLTGFMVNRKVFGHRLLREALDAGVKFLDRTLVLEPIFKNNFTVGVKVKDLARNKTTEIYGKVVLDASGVTAILRRKMPPNWQIERIVENSDLEACIQETREVSTQIEDPEYLKIILSRKIAPGGYYWIFPKGNNLVNVGLGVQMTKNFPNPKKQLYKHILSQSLFKNSKKINGRAGLIPTRRPINLVGNGILFAGDSACQTNPAHGSGIGPSMIAGKFAAQTACKAIETGDVSQKNLWSYNINYMSQYGNKYAGLDVYRIFIQKCRDEDFNYGMKNQLIKGEHIFSRTTPYEDLESNQMPWIRRTDTHPLLKALIQTSNNMKRIKKIYEQFPQPEGYSTWALKVKEIIEEMKEMTLETSVPLQATHNR